MSDFRFIDGWLCLFTIVISLLISGGGRCWFIAFAKFHLQSTQHKSHYLVLSHVELLVAFDTGHLAFVLLSQYLFH